MTSINTFLLLIFFANLKFFHFASINFDDAVFVPQKNEDLPKDVQQKFMFGFNGEKIITSSGNFVARYPTFENVFFFRLQTNATSGGSVLFCFETTEELKSQHYECDVGQCGMKLYFDNNAIYLNHDEYFLPYYSNETIIFGYSDQDNLKLRIGTKGFIEFPARCSLPNDFISVTYENQISFNVHYQLLNAKLEMATSYLVLKRETPSTSEETTSASASVTLGIVCAFLIPVLIVIGLGEGYVLWKKRGIFKAIFSKESKTVTKNQPPPLKT